MTRVLIADDHPRFRRAARAVVQATAGFEVVGEAASGEEALALLDATQPELVLMDIRMRGMGGIEAARRIADVAPRTMTILVSTYRREDLPPAARTCGARAYLHKADLEPSVLLRLYCSAR
jgi:DNA-binding NarL/FixJ family response regulator